MFYCYKYKIIMTLVNIYSLGLAFIFQTVIWWVKLFDGVKSKINVPSSGVPQGAILSTLLIPLLLNNPPSILHQVKILESAEDVKLFMNIQSILDRDITGRIKNTK